MKDWTREQTGENLEARLQLEAKAEQLVGGLQKAEGFLNASSSIVENVRQLVELGGEAGLPVDTNLVARLSEQIATLQTTVAAACETAEGVRQHVSPEYDGGEVGQNRAAGATKIVAGLLATFSQLDERLSDFAARTTEARDAMGRWNTQVHARLVAMAALATLFLLWMTVGQVCLWRRP